MTSPAQLKRSVTAVPQLQGASRREAAGVEIGLNAAIVAVADNEPVVLIIRGEADVAGALTGCLSDRSHRSSIERLRSV